MLFYQFLKLLYDTAQHIAPCWFFGCLILVCLLSSSPHWKLCGSWHFCLSFRLERAASTVRFYPSFTPSDWWGLMRRPWSSLEDLMASAFPANLVCLLQTHKLQRGSSKPKQNIRRTHTYSYISICIMCMQAMCDVCCRSWCHPVLPCPLKADVDLALGLPPLP